MSSLNNVRGVEHLEARLLFASDVVLTWNDVALQAIRTEKTPPPIASRALAIVHAAIYDAVNAIEKTGQVYAVDLLAQPDTSREAAVAAAARTALSSLFPNEATIFSAQFDADLDAVPDGNQESQGVTLGTNVANQLLALRANDGSGTTVAYTPSTEPGDWRPTPPANLSALLPQWGDVKPFAMTSDSQFRAEGPPSLTSTEYAAALNEVKDLGSVTSTTRTLDQTNIAKFWANGAGTATPPGHLNELAHVVADQRGNSLSQNARLFAMLNVALADAAISCWDAKYEFNFWRPITAIRAADTDGNAATEKDATWTSLLTTPNFPSYTSGHSTFSGAAAAVLKAFFGTDEVSFQLVSENPSVNARSFTSFSQAAAESAVSRLYAGIHFRFDNDDGLVAGTQIGNWVTNHFFKLQAPRVSAGMSGDVLVISGSDKTDYLSIDSRIDSYRVYNRGIMLGEFSKSQVNSIVVNARAGNDFVVLGNDITVSATIHGGSGRDYLWGGAADDHIFGDEGNDFLWGLNGDDVLEGGVGNDWLFGGLGQDSLAGGSGKNKLFRTY